MIKKTGSKKKKNSARVDKTTPTQDPKTSPSKSTRSTKPKVPPLTYDQYRRKVDTMTTIRWIGVIVYTFAVIIISLFPIFKDINEGIYQWVLLVIIGGGAAALIILMAFTWFRRLPMPDVPDGEITDDLIDDNAPLPDYYMDKVIMWPMFVIVVPLIIFYGMLIFVIPHLSTQLILGGTIALLIVIMLIFGKLTIELTPDKFYFHYGPIGKKIPMRDIKSIRSVSIRPLRDFMGWGIRLGPDGAWGYICQGKVGVRVKMRHDKEYVITMGNPQKIVNYVRVARKLARK